MVHFVDGNGCTKWYGTHCLILSVFCEESLYAVFFSITTAALTESDISIYAEDDNWDEANARCKKEGGEMVSIHSDSDNEALLAACPSVFDCWLGLSRSGGSSGNWKWSDGTSYNYNNFGGSTSDGSQNCAELDQYMGKWENTMCVYKYGPKPQYEGFSNTACYQPSMLHEVEFLNVVKCQVSRLLLLLVVSH